MGEWLRETIPRDFHGLNPFDQREMLAHQRDIYHSDCGLGLGTCEVLPSVPFRRLATRRIRIDVPLDGEGTLTAEHATSLQNVKQAYSDALASASARLLAVSYTHLTLPTKA